MPPTFILFECGCQNVKEKIVEVCRMQSKKPARPILKKTVSLLSYTGFHVLFHSCCFTFIHFPLPFMFMSFSSVPCMLHCFFMQFHSFVFLVCHVQSFCFLPYASSVSLSLSRTTYDHVAVFFPENYSDVESFSGHHIICYMEPALQSLRLDISYHCWSA